jgi:hypothetical protein
MNDAQANRAELDWPALLEWIERILRLGGGMD